jgi:hypothetical protein
VEPFKVFISSSQNEFARFRMNLKEVIDAEDFVNQRIMSAILVELRKGQIDADIEKGIREAAIYVGIFGRVYSDPTVKEFRRAKDNYLPILIYRLRRGRPRRRSVVSGRSKVDVFLRNEVLPLGIRVRGFYDEDSLEKAIMTDLAFQVADMVREDANIRKAIGR